MKKRVYTKEDLDLAMSVLPMIKKPGDDIAAVTKRLPLRPDDCGEPVITQEEEALLMHFLVFFRQNAEIVTCVEGILKSKENETSEGERWRLISFYRSFLKIAFADLLYQSQQIFEILGMTFNEADFAALIILGRESNRQKRKEYLGKHPDSIWY